MTWPRSLAPSPLAKPSRRSPQSSRAAEQGAIRAQLRRPYRRPLASRRSPGLVRVRLDENFPLGLQRGLREDGFEVDHIITLGWRGAPDLKIRQRLQDAALLFFTQDEDFLSGEPVPAVVVLSRVGQSRPLKERTDLWRSCANSRGRLDLVGSLSLSTTEYWFPGRTRRRDRGASDLTLIVRRGPGRHAGEPRDNRAWRGWTHS